MKNKVSMYSIWRGKYCSAAPRKRYYLVPLPTFLPELGKICHIDCQVIYYMIGKK